MFSASVSRPGVPHVTFPSEFMWPQVAGLQRVTPAVLIMWANKSARGERQRAEDGAGCRV